MPKTKRELDAPTLDFLRDLSHATHAIRRCVDGLEDKSGINLDNIRPIFEHHSETERQIAKHYPSRDRASGYRPGMDFYRERVRQWKRSAFLENLTKADVIRILGDGGAP